MAQQIADRRVIDFVLHEQFHQLTRGTLPAWMNESLATYFALKAVAQIYTDPADIAAARATFLHPDAKIDIGLLDVQHQLDKEHDFSHYSLFYSQGAAFWDKIDKALAKATNGAKTLDDVLPAITSTSYTGDAALPPHVKDALSEIPKDAHILSLCNTGNRAGKSAAILEKNGYSVRAVGGLKEWGEKGWPLL